VWMCWLSISQAHMIKPYNWASGAGNFQYLFKDSKVEVQTLFILPSSQLSFVEGSSRMS